MKWSFWRCEERSTGMIMRLNGPGNVMWQLETRWAYLMLRNEREAGHHLRGYFPATQLLRCRCIDGRKVTGELQNVWRSVRHRHWAARMGWGRTGQDQPKYQSWEHWVHPAQDSFQKHMTNQEKASGFKGSSIRPLKLADRKWVVLIRMTVNQEVSLCRSRESNIRGWGRGLQKGEVPCRGEAVSRRRKSSQQQR